MKKVKKFYVLRGGALLSQKRAWLCFGKKGDTIVVPMSVITKLYYFDKAKKDYARDFCDFIASCELSKLMGNGVRLENGVYLKVMSVDIIPSEVSNSLAISTIDDNSLPETLAVCLKLISLAKNSDNVILVSQNIPLLLRANTLGIKSEYVPDTVFPAPDKRYTGKASIVLHHDIVDEIQSSGRFDINSLDPVRDKLILSKLSGLHENQFVFINNFYIARYSHGMLLKLALDRAAGFDFKNFEQHCATEALFLDPAISPLVVIEGVAGTGKTFVTIQSALAQVNKYYQKIIIATPAVGGHVSDEEAEKYGYLPGDIIDKLSPMLGGIIDNIVNPIVDANVKIANMTLTEARRDAEDKARTYFEDGIIEVQPLAYVAGHSLSRTFVIIDEAQNIQPSYFLDIVTRAANGSKFAILGDPDQVKVSSLSRRINGIVFMMEKWKNSTNAFQISMDSKQCVRSALCQEAIELLS